MLRIEATEAEEPAAAINDRRGALQQVPMADIKTRIAHQMEIFEKSGDEIEPALFIMHALRDFVPAMAIDAVLPPLQKCPRGRASTDSEKSDVIHARLKDIELALVSVRARQRSQEMRRQCNGMLGHTSQNGC